MSAPKSAILRDLFSSAILMLGVALAAAVIVGGLLGAAGCPSVKDGARAVADDLVDCTIATAKAHADEYGPLVEAAIRAAVRSDGSVDWTAIAAASRGFGLETGACTVAATVARLLSPAPASDPPALVATPAPSSSELRSGFAELSRQLWGGRKFRTSAGVL